MTGIIQAKPMQGKMRKIPVQEFAKAIEFRAYYIVVQIVLGSMTAKKTREWLHSLAPATGVATIQPSLNDFHRVTNMESFACIKAGSEVYIFQSTRYGLNMSLILACK